MPFYERGDVRIHYEEAGTGAPLLVIPGGGLNSTAELLKRHPFDPFEVLSDQHRVIAAPLALRHVRTFLRAHGAAAARPGS